MNGRYLLHRRIFYSACPLARGGAVQLNAFGEQDTAPWYVSGCAVRDRRISPNASRRLGSSAPLSPR
ncbi:hypothetical protein N7541_009266 [Penicillium brevicompactum]|uniref:Uncharacterized protein n=1 Tax=Penicillium brevicompactum TaxID=5074 RepID=A0A9W9QLB4_PENBR|nr:hypothetical protein N7541_009266 [Penicillium brevicompactum]